MGKTAFGTSHVSQNVPCPARSGSVILVFPSNSGIPLSMLNGGTTAEGPSIPVHVFHSEVGKSITAVSLFFIALGPSTLHAYWVMSAVTEELKDHTAHRQQGRFESIFN